MRSPVRLRLRAFFMPWSRLLSKAARKRQGRQALASENFYGNAAAVWFRRRETIYDMEIKKAGEGNRTPVVSLGSWNSAIELHPRKRGLYCLSAEDDTTIVITMSSRSLPGGSAPEIVINFQKGVYAAKGSWYECSVINLSAWQKRLKRRCFAAFAIRSRCKEARVKNTVE